MPPSSNNTGSTAANPSAAVQGLNAARDAAVSSGQSAYGGSLANLSTYSAANPNVASAPPPVSQTQDAHAINNNLSGGSTAIATPTALPAPHTNGTSANTGIPNPIPTADSIVNDNTPSTPAQTQQKSILDRIAGLVGQKKGQTDLTNTAEASAGVPALQKTVNDLNTQLEGLNNQAEDLKNQALPGGAIENQNQQNAFGRGITAAGLAPMTAGDLRKNQIQQSAIASQALTLKSAIYGAQGNLTLAKDAADKAATAQYEDQQNQIDAQKAQLDALMPQLTKDEKNQALIVQTKLQDRQTQIQQAQDDKKTIIAMATAVLQGQPNNPQAQYAAQQALAESNKQQPDLQKVLGLIGGYQTLDTQLKVAQIAEARQSAAKTALETQQLREAGSGGGLAAANQRQTTSGITYIDGTNLTGKDATAAQQAAAKAGIPYLDKTSADLQNNIETARQNMQNIQNSLDGVLPHGVGSGFNYIQKAGNVISGATQIGDNAGTLGAFNAYRSAAIQALRAMAGAKGLRINQAEIMQSVNNDIPKVTDTQEVAQKKIQVVNSLLDSQEKGTFGSQYYQPSTTNAPSGTTVMTGPQGTFNVPNDQVATFKANGYK